MSQIKWTNKFTAFAVGVGAGALLAMLFAPASGEDTREYLTGSLKQGLDGAASTGKALDSPRARDGGRREGQGSRCG